MRSQAVCALICTAWISCLAHAGDYQAVRIVAPEADVTVHDNSGNLAVTVLVSPPLRVESDDRIVLLLDGKAVASGSAQRFVLRGVDRGRHTLQARVTAADGMVLAASPPVRFQMWQASRLFPRRTN